MSYPKLTPIIAKGATEPRYLEDRFTDAVNVKDFGAKGDGVTDDTAAFLAAKNIAGDGIVYVPSGTYNISGKVFGNFLGDDSTVITGTGSVASLINFSEVVKNVDKLIRATPPAISLLGDPVDCGGDHSSSTDPDDMVGRAVQSCFVDPFENILVTTYTAGATVGGVRNAGEQTQIVLSHWDEKSINRTFIRQSTFQVDFLSHQGVSLYRPSPSDSPKLVCLQSFTYKNTNDVNTNDLSRIQYCRVMSFDYETLAHQTLKTFKLWGDDGNDGINDYSTASVGTVQLCLSYDGKYLVSRAIRLSDSKKVYRVWDFPAILEKYKNVSSADITRETVFSFTSPFGNVEEGGQGIYCDGKYIYDLDSNYTRLSYGINIVTITGKKCGTIYREFPDVSSLYDTTVSSLQIEAENIFFAPVFGKIEMFVTGSIMEAYIDVDDNNAIKRKRYNRYFSQTISSPLEIAYQTIEDGDTIVRLPFYGYAKGDELSGSRYNVLQFTDQNKKSSYDTRLAQVGAVLMESITQLRLQAYNTNKSAATSGGVVLQYSTDNSQIQFRPHQQHSGEFSNLLGSPSYHWSEVYGENASINTSDRRRKTGIDSFPEEVLDAWGDVEWKQYKMVDAVSQKGENARLHSGVIAQDIAEIFAARGLDASRYGLFCYDEWQAETENGTVVNAAGNAYGIRYGEALSLEAAYLRSRISKMQEQIDTLVERINQLTNNSK